MVKVTVILSTAKVVGSIPSGATNMKICSVTCCFSIFYLLNSIFLNASRAFNLLNGQNITKHIQVQNVLTEARVEARPRDTFINKTVMLMAGVTPQSTPVTFLWDFRDGSAPLLSATSSVEHVYAFPGQYLVQVH